MIRKYIIPKIRPFFTGRAFMDDYLNSVITWPLCNLDLPKGVVRDDPITPEKRPGSKRLGNDDLARMTMTISLFYDSEMLE